MTTLGKMAVSWLLVGFVLAGLWLGETDAAEKVDFHTVLASIERAPEVPESENLYGWLVGSWDMQPTGGAVVRVPGELHVGRVLEGRAIQDVWIWPTRANRQGPLDPKVNTYGTTLRLWDKELRAWRITYLNPLNGRNSQLIGRRSGKDIVQVGTDSNGVTVRWSFVEIKQDSFRWTGETLEPDGRTWKMNGDFRATRLR